MPESWLNELNPSQRDGATHGDGPLLIIAGAGTGKTRTLVARLATLLSRGVAPERILLLTFTRRAAAEMIRRAGRLCGETTAGRVWGGTFHAVANRLLRMYGRAIGLSPDFSLMDESDAADFMNLIRSELGHSKGNRRFPRKDTLVSIYSRTVNAQQPVREVVTRNFPWCMTEIDGVASICNLYAQRKLDQNLLDYDDLLLYWNALCDAPDVGTRVADRFDHILVDEYQDTNPIQAQILRGMRKGKPNICVVGDDAQSIYSFRSATIRNILDFPRIFPGTRTVTLEQNYRSTTPILAASNAVMEQAKERYTKNLWSGRASDQKPVLMLCTDEPNQTDAVCENILAHLERGVALMKQTVLFRTGHHSAHLEIELARRNIPFHKFGGLKFLEAAHIKDLISLLRVIENPHDEVAWFRVLQLIEGIGPRSAGRIMEELGVRRVEANVIRDRATATSPPAPELTYVTPLLRLFRSPPHVPLAVREPFDALRAAFAECSGVRFPTGLVKEGGVRPRVGPADGEPTQVTRVGPPPIASQIDCLRRFYLPILERRHDNPTVRGRDLEVLQSIAAGYTSRERFISDLTLDPPTSTSDLAQPPHLDEDWLTLSTIHSAKGCEWEVVHILHAADGMIPSDMAVGDEGGVDEERRLFYVAMTRAKDNLYVYFPFRYYHRKHALGDGHGYAQVTRFLSPAVRALFEDRRACVEMGSAIPDDMASGGAVVRDRVRKLFQV